jgi:hypothetical protein
MPSKKCTLTSDFEKAAHKLSEDTNTNCVGMGDSATSGRLL